MRKKIAAAAFAAGTTLLLTAAPASAAQSYDPNVSRVANPANACKSIPGSLSALGLPAPAGFDYSECVRTLAKGEAYIDGPGLGSPYDQCAALEKAGVITYPYTFYAGEGFERLLPDLVAKNRKECGSALYAFHTIVNALPGPPPGA